MRVKIEGDNENETPRQEVMASLVRGGVRYMSIKLNNQSQLHNTQDISDLVTFLLVRHKLDSGVGFDFKNNVSSGKGYEIYLLG